MQLLLLPVVALVVLLLVLALPVLLPILAFLAERDRRRLRIAAEATPCARCGRRLGLAAVESADAAWAAVLAGLMQHQLRRRVVRRLFARCVSCGADHGWDERRRTLHPLPAGPRGAPDPPR